MDISIFGTGSFIIDTPGFVYEVMRFKYTTTKHKREIEASICRNIKTNEEKKVSWGKGKNIRFKEATPEEIENFKQNIKK